MGKTRIKELEATLLDQIEKLNDDSIFEDADKAKILIERSKAIFRPYSVIRRSKQNET